jgi:hypothetical protein
MDLAPLHVNLACLLDKRSTPFYKKRHRAHASGVPLLYYALEHVAQHCHHKSLPVALLSYQNVMSTSMLSHPYPALSFVPPLEI